MIIFIKLSIAVKYKNEQIEFLSELFFGNKLRSFLSTSLPSIATNLFTISRISTFSNSLQTSFHLSFLVSKFIQYM